MGLSGKKILVVGLGESGLAIAGWLAGQGARVMVSERQTETALEKDVVDGLLKSGIEIELGGHTVETFLAPDLIVVSPGIPLDIEPLVAAGNKGIPVVGEIELASRYVKAPIIAITGTNGKSTVVNLIADMLVRGGKETFVGGNIGHALTHYLTGKQTADYAVLELSSFQLDTIQTFSPLVAVILNGSPDHLDRYRDYDAYLRSKERIFLNQRPDQILIINDDDPWLRDLHPTKGPAVYRYGLEKGAGRYAYTDDDEIVAHLAGGKEVRLNMAGFTLPGFHNRANAMAAVLTALALKIAPSAIQEAIDGFHGLPHRLEYVDTMRGVSFYNDSKATNIDAAIKSATSFESPVILIAGGRHKGSDYLPFVEAVSGRVKSAVFLGEASALLAEAFDERVPWKEANDMVDAVSLAFNEACEGDVVLLAPACSSFDMFKNFEQRGIVFRDVVKRLKNGL